MKISLVLFSVAAAIAWATLFYISAHAVSAMGTDAAGQIFFGDFSHPWRAQFNADFSIHLLLVAAWMIWRTPNRIVGVVCGALAVCFGALFTLPFVVLATWRGGGIAAALVRAPRAVGARP